MTDNTSFAPLAGLPEPVRSRFVDNGNGLTLHLLEAGDTHASKPCLLLLHGFPELAYSWRKIMVPLAHPIRRPRRRRHQ